MSVRPAVVAVATGAAVASFAVGVPPANSATETFRGHWPLNETRGHIAKDTSGHHHDGHNSHVSKDGSAYTFNGRSSRVVVPNAPSLNPKGKAFSFRARLKMDDPPQAGESYDVLRKGLVTSGGGDYKLEIVNRGGEARAHCVVHSVLKNGNKVLASIVGSSDLADGAFHTVTCSKTSTGLELQVDSLLQTLEKRLGTVSNRAKLGLGAKAENHPKTGFDWFDGVISNAWVASP